MASQSDEKLKKTLTVEASARNISQNVRCTECGSQSIEDSQADVAILLRKVIVAGDQNGRSSPPFSTAAIISAASQAPMPTPPMHQQPTTLETPIGNPWSTGLFDCQEHDTNAVMTAFFPCVTFGQIAEILDGGQTSCIMGSLMYILMAPALCSCWIISSGYRRKLRQMYNLVEAPAEDWTVHLFCPCCSLCQEFRELKNRGTDPSLGWMGNLALRRNSAAATSTAPPNPQFMSM